MLRNQAIYLVFLYLINIIHFTLIVESLQNINYCYNLYLPKTHYYLHQDQHHYFFSNPITKWPYGFLRCIHCQWFESLYRIQGWCLASWILGQDRVDGDWDDCCLRNLFNCCLHSWTRMLYKQLHKYVNVLKISLMIV